jgi:predicted nucleic acid-binding protein
MLSFTQSSDAELWIGAMQRAEIVFLMRPNEEAPTNSFLSQFQTLAVTKDIVDCAGALYRQWHGSHGVDVNDALLAATVAKTGGKIITQNLKHYPMPDIVVQSGW